MADDSMKQMLQRLRNLSPEDATDKMTQLMQPEEMQQALAQTEADDDLARIIQQRMSASQLRGSGAEGAADFAERYADKMKAPAGMAPESIGDETARLGMKVPKEIRRGALSRLAGKVAGGLGRIAGPVAGLVGALNPEELGGNEIVEDPDIPAGIRAMAARAGEAQMREEGAEEQEFLELDQERRARMQALMEKLRQESGE